MRPNLGMFLATVSLWGGATLAAAQDGPGGMMALQACSMLEASGAAEVTIDGETREAVSVFKSGPNGEALVAIGELAGVRQPEWCMAIVSAVPVGDETLQVSTPEILLQTRDGVMAVMATLGDEDGYFEAAHGTVGYSSGAILEGRFDMKGTLEASDGKREISIQGWFKAVEVD